MAFHDVCFYRTLISIYKTKRLALLLLTPIQRIIGGGDSRHFGPMRLLFHN